MKNTKQSILIVDDVPANIKVLAEVLHSNYQLSMVTNGRDALEVVFSEEIDLILLDIMMPEMDGYEVCDRLKREPNTKDIPIVFITARDSVQDVAKGLSLGAVDYITKPFDKDIVRARIKNHLSLKKYHDAVRRANIKLHETNTKLENEIRYREESEKQQERQVQLVHANRLATLGEMATGIAHELNQPLAGISYTATFLKKAFELKKLNDEDFLDSLGDIFGCVKRMSKIINHLRSFCRQDDFDFGTVDINATVDGALTLLGAQLRLHDIEIIQNYDESLPAIQGNSSQIEQVWINHITNSRDSLDEKGEKLNNFKKILTITTEYNDVHKTIDVIFDDNGMGMTKEVQDKMFNPFFTTKDVGKGTGLGLSVSHGIISSHKGTYEICSTEGEETAIRIRLPVTINEE